MEPRAAAAIERMAAAVAAALAQGRDPVVTIRFNDPGAVAEGAVLIREPGGALAVRLEGVSPALAAGRPALEQELRVALDRRRVRLSRVEWGASAAPGRGVTFKPPRFVEAT